MNQLNFNYQDWKQLRNLLIGIPILESVRGRKLVIMDAGLVNILDNFDLSGASISTIPTILDYLIHYGEKSKGITALGAFLVAVKNYTPEEKYEDLENLLQKYNLNYVPKDNEKSSTELEFNILRNAFISMNYDARELRLFLGEAGLQSMTNYIDFTGLPIFIISEILYNVFTIKDINVKNAALTKICITLLGRNDIPYEMEKNIMKILNNYKRQ